MHFFKQSSTMLQKDSFAFCYYDRDHLGSVREVTRAFECINIGTAYLRTDYYPSGLRLCDGTADSGAQPYKYNFSIERGKRKLAYSSEREKNRPEVNGKELDRMNGLDWYDYGARHMDGARYILRTLRQPLLDILCDQRNAGSCHNFPKHYTNPLTR